MTKCLLLLLSFNWLGSFPRGGVQLARSASEPPKPRAGAGEVYHLACGLQAKVQGRVVVITNKAGTVVARNSQLIRLEDENTYCPSGGGEQIVSKGDYFTIEQQTCEVNYFVNEYITFHYEPAFNKIMLHKYGRVSTDRRDPNKVIPMEVYTAKQFGQRSFTQVTKASLAVLSH